MNAEKITSAHNPLIKKLVQLSNKQSARTKSNLTILDGVHLTREYLTKIGKPELCVVSEGARSAEVAKILVDCNSRIVRVVEIPKSLFVKISPNIEFDKQLFYLKQAKESNCQATIVSDDHITSPFGLVIHTNEPVQVDEKDLRLAFSNLWEEKKTETPKKSIWKKWLG